MPIKLKNNVRSTLAMPLTTTDTQAKLVAGGGSEFPSLGAGEHFYATIVSSDGTIEIVYVSAVSGDYLTIIRGAESTTPAEFSRGSLVELRVTVASITDAIMDLGGGDMRSVNNLSDVASVSAARTNLGVYSTAQVDSAITVANAGDLRAANNLSDVASVPSARTNLGVYSTSQVDAAIAAATTFENTFSIGCSFVPLPTNDETLGLYVFTETVQFSANWSGAQYESAVLPTATTTITIYKNPTFTGDVITGGTVAGTVSINTSGVATFATTGGTAVSYATGDSVGFKNQAAADATARGSFTLKGVVQ
jgi:hypothetical protein